MLVGLPRPARGVMARDRFPPGEMRMFDPEIWREVTGGAVGERVRRLTRVTPLVPAAALGRRTGADVWLKLENLQRTGSFKLRGAAARLAALALDSAAGGPAKRVIAASAGNHGLGVALAAQAFGVAGDGAGVGADARDQARRHRRAGRAGRGGGRHLRRRRGRGAPPRRRRPGPGLRVGVRRRPRDRRQRRPAGARDPGAAARRAVDRRAGRRRRARRRAGRRDGAARDPDPGRLARGELRDAPLARRRQGVHVVRRRPRRWPRGWRVRSASGPSRWRATTSPTSRW